MRTWKPGDLEARGPGSQGTWKPGDLEHEDLEARGPGSQGTWKPGDLEHEDLEHEDLEARGPGAWGLYLSIGYTLFVQHSQISLGFFVNIFDKIFYQNACNMPY
jgi:hypothetical protein